MDPSLFVNMIIRPPRNEYDDLKNDFTKVHPNGKTYKLDNFTVTSPLGHALSCTFVEPAND
jgi:hypothetical protein